MSNTNKRYVTLQTKEVIVSEFTFEVDVNENDTPESISEKAEDLLHDLINVGGINTGDGKFNFYVQVLNQQENKPSGEIYSKEDI